MGLGLQLKLRVWGFRVQLLVGLVRSARQCVLDRAVKSDDKFPLKMETPKGPCAQTVYTLGPMYLYSEYLQAKVHTIGKL